MKVLILSGDRSGSLRATADLGLGRIVVLYYC
jgi:hypothetical protein